VLRGFVTYSRHVRKPMKLRHKPARGEACSVLDELVIIDGDLRFNRTLRISGTLTGSVMTSGRLIILPEGRIDASVQARDVTIYGWVTGDVSCDNRVEICNGAVLRGNVRSPQLLIEEGGRFEGSSLWTADSANGLGSPGPVEELENESDRHTLEVRTG